MKFVWFNYLCLLVIGALASVAVLYPRDVLAAFALSDAHEPLLLMGAIAVGGGAFLWLSGALCRTLFRRLRSFRRLSRHSQATVSVEFILVIPIAACMMLTLFQMIEIAHAQLVFRYASFAAARSGAVIGGNEWVSLSWKNANNGNQEPEMPDAVKGRILLAAALPLAGLDTGLLSNPRVEPLFLDPRVVAIENLVGKVAIKDAKMINFAGVSSATVEPWKRKNLLASKVNKVVAVIASGADIKYENAQMTEEVKLSLVGTVQKITNIVMGVVWDILGDIAGQILGKVIDDKINGAEIASELAKELTKELAKVGAGELIGRILGILSYFHSMGMDAFLDLFNGNPPETTPPQVSIKFTYKMKLRPGSLFWLIAGGDRSITLNRNDGARQRGQVGTPPLLMHTSGQYFDRPGMAPELWAVNYFPGDSTFPDPEDDDWDPQKMFGREMFGY